MNDSRPSRLRRVGLAAVALVAGTALAIPITAGAGHPDPAGDALTNAAHLDFLLDEVTLSAVEGHDTYDLAGDPTVELPWTYADARDGGTFERIGGGPLDPATGDYAQGAFNADDVSRAAVVYLRHWQQTGDAASRERAYEVLRALAYFQTTTGDDAGNVVLWMQTDGELNPSAEPIELPDPSDSDDSYWLARTIWAYGEGFAAFADDDPEFAAFLQQRLQLAVSAVERDVLVREGEYVQADGVDVPAWLIADGADATSEALLGLSAYLEAVPDDHGVRDATAALADGVAELARTTTEADVTAWPYGAILPWAASRSMWHAWSSQMAAGLFAASGALDDASLAEPALVDAGSFAPTLLTAGGPDNAWYPSPTERVQIAYGADSRVQVLYAAADATDSAGFADLAAMQASWFFGANPAAQPMYSAETGVTYDGIQADGTINRNSGAESTIHGLLAMLALDEHGAGDRAQALSSIESRDGLRMVEAEDAVSTTGTVETPENWTGESSWSGDALRLAPGRTATIDVGSGGARLLEPVAWSPQSGRGAEPRSLWFADQRRLGTITHEVGAQGITEVPGALLPARLDPPLAAGVSQVEVRAAGGADVLLDGVLVRPEVSRLVLGGDARSELLVNAVDEPRTATAGADGVRSSVATYDAAGVPQHRYELRGTGEVHVPAGGFALVLG